jgi:hypothetical protein
MSFSLISTLLRLSRPADKYTFVSRGIGRAIYDEENVWKPSKDVEGEKNNDIMDQEKTDYQVQQIFGSSGKLWKPG